MSANNGGPAFPRQHANADADKPGFVRGHEGMTLRDYFAAKAMQAILSLGDGYDYSNFPAGTATTLVIANHSYAMADAMLAERAKGGE